MNGSRTIRLWKAQLYRNLEPGMILTIFRSDKGRRTIIVSDTRYSSSTGLTVIELTPENALKIANLLRPVCTKIKVEEFISDDFHIVDPPSPPRR